MTNWQERIVVDPAILVGKPIIRGTRIAVEHVVGLLAQGWTEEDVLRAYPHVTRDDILACLAYAAQRLTSERIYPLAS
jgi:uncharacterized protein (DUF433 family)